MNSSNCNSDNQSDSSFLTEESGTSKKRKLSMVGNSLSNVQLKVLQFENQTLKQLVQEFENDNEFNGLKAKITELEEIVAKLQKENSDMQKKNEVEKNQLKIQNNSLNSIISDLTSKTKIVENEKKQLESKIEELKILLIKNIKSELKDSVGSEKTILEGTIDKLNSEINDLKNKLADKEKVIHNSVVPVNDESDIIVEKICNKLQQFLTSSNSEINCFKKSKKMDTSKSGTSTISKSTKLQEEAPKLTVEEQIIADNYSSGHFEKGARVYAIWDKEYYSAICGGYDGLSRYKVFYTDDQSIRIIPRDSIVPICMIKEGSLVTVLGETVNDGGREICDGKVLAIPSIENTEEWHRGLYKIEIQDDVNAESREIEWFDICFTESQYKKIIKGFKKKTDVFQENFVESGHRTRRFNAAAVGTAAASTSSTKRR
uniref:Tudor domain-containing protein n=1 Tax=Panagrolaimus sp. PS1159 TaxID=55785 RepID=A0AC35F7E8_9BILA